MYTLGPLERKVRGGLFDSEGGGCQILFGQIIYFWFGLGREIHFHVAWARENLFSCKHGKPYFKSYKATVNKDIFL